MQPYFLPYLGYWQLINASSKFIAFDDVNYIKKGFIDRNTIHSNNQLHSIKLQVRKASQNRPINQHDIVSSPQDLLLKIKSAYSRYPVYKEVLPTLEAIFEHPETNLALFVENSIRMICGYCSISTPIARSSEFSLSEKGKERIIPLVKASQGHTYLNMEGGRHLYEELTFSNAGLELRFFRPSLPSETFNAGFPDKPMSIIDLMMRFDRHKIKEMVALGHVV